MAKSEGNVVTFRDALDRWGREALLLFFLGAHWRKPVDFSEETMAQAQARAETFRNAYTQQKAKRKLQLWDDFADALEDDFDTPRALAVMHEWASNGQHDLLTEALEIFGLKSLSEPEPPPEEIVALAEARQAARDAGNFEEADRAAGRARGGGMGDARPHRRLRAPAEEGVTADLVYGRRAVREALRGRREVLELWTTERALKAEPWLGGGARPRAAGARADRARGRRATTRAWSRASSRIATPTPTSWPRPSGRCSPCSTASPTRATSARSAGPPRAPGATGVVVPAHGSAVVTPAVARSSAGAIEHLPIGGRHEPGALPRRR